MEFREVPPPQPPEPSLPGSRQRVPAAPALARGRRPGPRPLTSRCVHRGLGEPPVNASSAGGTATRGVGGATLPPDAIRGCDVALAADLFSRFGVEEVWRWLHVVVGIAWIGLLYYFNVVQVPSFAELDPATRNQSIDKLASR